MSNHTHHTVEFIHLTHSQCLLHFNQDVSNTNANENDGERPKKRRTGRGGANGASAAAPAATTQVTQASEGESIATTKARRVSRYRKAKPVFATPPNRLQGESYQYVGEYDRMDERDAVDPLCATEYVQDMYEIFREKELTTSARCYMDRQTYISPRMRAILVDWLVEVHLKFRLVPETLHLAVNLVDRYLESKEGMCRKNLQLVGVTSLMIAAKYEEIYPLELDQLVYICDNAYSCQDLLDMEYSILRELSYGVTIPSAHTFLVRFLKAAHADKKLVQLSCMILDGTLLSHNLLGYLPSQLAAASIAIARHSYGRNIWSPTLLRFSFYSQEEVMPVARAVLKQRSEISEDLRSVYKKYSSTRYGSVADTVVVSFD